tara:strand:+ start:308 stop:700 length:393 start_codon:yes stop_codon:yes gene_type:complete
MSQTKVLEQKQRPQETPDITDALPHEDVQITERVAIWDQPIPTKTQAAVKSLLDYMIAHNIAPRIDIKAPLVPGVIEAMESFMPLFPDHLQDDTKTLFDYLIKWISDYAYETRMKNADLKLELGQKEHKS